MFKRHIDEQRKSALSCINVIKKVIQIAYTDNVPILASKQMYEKVFSKYKEQAFAQEKACFDEQIAERDEMDAAKQRKEQQEAAAAMSEMNSKSEPMAHAAQSRTSKSKKQGAFQAKKLASMEINLKQQNRLTSQ